MSFRGILSIANQPKLTPMNPLLYKAHPLMILAADAFLNPGAHSLYDYSRLALILLSCMGLWASVLVWAVNRAADFRVAYWRAFLFALPAVLLYLLPVVTVVTDVIGHKFHWRDRFLLVFAMVVASQMLGVLYAFGIRHPRYERVLGLQTGIEVALVLLLAAMLTSVVLGGLQEIFGIW